MLNEEEKIRLNEIISKLEVLKIKNLKDEENLLELQKTEVLIKELKRKISQKTEY